MSGYIMSITQVQLRFDHFKKDREDVNNDARPGCPSTSTTNENIDAVKKMILDKHRITIRDVDEDGGIWFDSCQAIFTNILGMKRAATKIAKF